MRKAFVMMPYTPEFEKVYDTAIRPAIEETKLTPTLVKDEHYVGAVFEKVQDSIAEAELCIADVTGGNPNVMWEAAYGQALGKPVVFIAQGTPEAIPFNIRHNRCIIYETSSASLADLRRKITNTIRAILDGEVSDLHVLVDLQINLA